MPRELYCHFTFFSDYILFLVYTDMRQLIFVLLIAKIGFMANDSVTALKLLDKGFHKEDLALAV